MSELALCRVDAISFEVCAKKGKAPIGQAVVDFTIGTEGRSADSQYEARVPLDSVWVDPDKKVAAKAHMRISSGNSLHRALFGAVSRFGYVRTQYSGMFVTADRGRLLRYGAKAGDFYSDSGADYVPYNLYDSSVQALRACLQVVSGYKQIGGLAGISLRHVNKSVLTEFGFEEIPDTLGVGPSMWKGNVDRFLNMGEGYVGYSKLCSNAQAFLKYIKGCLA